ncbi:hypothetical protein [Phormidium nigroviride]
MKTLMLFISKNEQFDPQQIALMLQEIPGTNNLKEGNFVGSILECEFSDENNFSLIRLSDDLETITISGMGGMGNASLKISLEIQKRYPKPLRLIDSDYTFDLVLEKILSLSELRQKILESSSVQLSV